MGQRFFEDSNALDYFGLPILTLTALMEKLLTIQFKLMRIKYILNSMHHFQANTL